MENETASDHKADVMAGLLALAFIGAVGLVYWAQRDTKPKLQGVGKALRVKLNESQDKVEYSKKGKKVTAEIQEDQEGEPYFLDGKKVVYLKDIKFDFI